MTHPKEKLIWDSAKVDDKKEYWQKYNEKEEEIKLDKDKINPQQDCMHGWAPI